MGWFVTRASAASTPGGNLPVGAGFRAPCWAASAQAGGLTLRMRDDGSVARVRGR
jgi:hypothetical protein